MCVDMGDCPFYEEVYILSDDKSLQLEIDAKALLGEGPCWDADEQILYWVDIPNKSLHIYDTKTKTDKAVNLNKQISSVVVRESGGLVVTMENGIHFFDVDSNTLDLIVDPESDIPGNRFNDGKCDPEGRFWAGTMSFDESEGAGSLYLLNSDLSISKVKENVTISNGITWSPDYRVMYYVDSPTKQVVAYDYNISTGEISNERVVITIPDGEGLPDGITSDLEGNIWIAHWDGGKVSRWNPMTGKLLDFISIPVSKVTSCIFGGENLNELYITTASIGLDDKGWEHEPHAGGVFRLMTNIQGMPTFKFKG